MALQILLIVWSSLVLSAPRITSIMQTIIINRVKQRWCNAVFCSYHKRDTPEGGGPEVKTRPLAKIRSGSRLSSISLSSFLFNVQSNELQRKRDKRQGIRPYVCVWPLVSEVYSSSLNRSFIESEENIFLLSSLVWSSESLSQSQAPQIEFHPQGIGADPHLSLPLCLFRDWLESYAFSPLPFIYQYRF